jgi:hypothetical protein
VTVHAALNCEHIYQDSFTLCRGCTHSPGVVTHPLYPGTEPLPLAIPQGHIHTAFGMRPGDHYRAFQWLPLACNVPTEVSLEVLATTKPRRAPSCALWVLATTKPTHLQPDGLSSNTIHTAGWYAKTSPYHILSLAIPI